MKDPKSSIYWCDGCAARGEKQSTEVGSDGLKDLCGKYKETEIIVRIKAMALAMLSPPIGVFRPDAMIQPMPPSPNIH